MKLWLLCTTLFLFHILYISINTRVLPFCVSSRLPKWHAGSVWKPVPVSADAEFTASAASRQLKEELDRAVPPHELLDTSASRSRAELASKGGLSQRHPPNLKRNASNSSSGSMVRLVVKKTCCQIIGVS